MSEIAIVDYGMGNIESVKKAFLFLGADCTVTNQPDELRNAKAIVLPGVGAFHAAIENLHNLGLSDGLSEMVINKKIPFLGICLGMQLIASDSTEQQYTKGLGWIDANVTRIESNDLCRVPHVGWNEISYDVNSILFRHIGENPHFYFDHSYHLTCHEEVVLSTCQYGGKRIASVEKNNIFAVQFHPEKSQRNGLRILRNFINYVTETRKC